MTLQLTRLFALAIVYAHRRCGIKYNRLAYVIDADTKSSWGTLYRLVLTSLSSKISPKKSVFAVTGIH